MQFTGKLIITICVFRLNRLLLQAATNGLVNNLKRLGHAILGNFSTDQVVIELTKI